MSTATARPGKGAILLVLLGLALVGLGAAFAYAPKISWKLAQVAQQANALGLQNGALVVGGLVVLGLGIVARIAAPAAPAQDTREELEGLQAEIHLLNEQLSTKLGQLRTALLQLQEGVTAVSAQQLATMQEAQAPAPDQSQDAVFRLAASLDKLHAHFDERVHAIDLQLRNGFETLLNAGSRARPQAAHAPQSPAAPLPSYPTAPSYPTTPSYPTAPSYDQPLPPADGIDFYQTMQKLDAIAGGPLDEVEDLPHAHPQPPFPSMGSGMGHGTGASGGHGALSNSGVDELDALLPEEYRDRY